VSLPHFQAALICELAYLRCFLAWEVFLEECFYAYMLGKESPCGSTFRRYVTPTDARHARRLVKGARKFSTWADSTDVAARAKLFFRDGDPFATALGAASSDLADMVKIRNRIAHRSGTAKSEFLDLVRRRHGSVPPGTNAGRFLLGIDSGATANRFSNYLAVIQAGSRVIAP
jgi:hypothetical protein